jgi:hypothetical protein
MEKGARNPKMVYNMERKAKRGNLELIGEEFHEFCVQN